MEPAEVRQRHSQEQIDDRCAAGLRHDEEQLDATGRVQEHLRRARRVAPPLTERPLLV